MDTQAFGIYLEVRHQDSYFNFVFLVHLFVIVLFIKSHAGNFWHMLMGHIIM